MDSGNVYRNVASPSFLSRLRLNRHHLRKVEHATVQTAKKGAALEVWGETKYPLKLRFAGLATVFKTRLVIVRGLSHELNLCGPFLKRHQIDQIHSQNALRVQGHLIPLSPRGEKGLPGCYNKAVSSVYTTEKRVIPPQSIAHLQLRAPEVEKGEMRAGDGQVKGEPEFSEKTNTHPWVSGYVTCADDGTLVGGVMNLTDEAVTIPQGMRYGDFCNEDWEVDGNQGVQICELSEEQHSEAPEKWSAAQKRNWVTEQFKLLENPVLKEPGRLKQAQECLVRHFAAFSINGEFGKTELIQHHIPTTPGPPIKCKSRPLNPIMEAKLKTQVNEWEKHDVAEPCQSPWSVPLVPVLKKGPAKEVRWCCDFRRLNARTIKDTFPLPNIEDNLSRLSRSQFFSGIDGAGAYHVVAIAPEDRDKTAFSTPFGTYRFKRMRRKWLQSNSSSIKLTRALTSLMQVKLGS